MTSDETIRINDCASVYRTGSFGVNEYQLMISVGYQTNTIDALSIEEGKTPVQKIIPLKSLEGLLNDKKAVTEHFIASVSKNGLIIKFCDGFECVFNQVDYMVLKRELEKYRMKQIF
jgi:hypothetical protein